ncbi:MAG: NADPH:quinone oxidoreductase family protein [Pseudomonadota bacterium]
MRAIQVFSTGGPAVLADVERPALAPGKIRVEIRACGLNFADLLMQKGTYQDTPEVPFTLGLELAGNVVEIADDVAAFSMGDRVMVFSGQGGLAEEGVFDAARALVIPDEMSFEHAAAFPIAYGTGHIALDHRARLQPGETLLVTGAAGGVGLTAVELAKLMGARVIAHARGKDKLEIARIAGADEVIDDAEDLRARLKELGGIDVLYDAVGGPVFTAAFRAANPEARLLPIGFASGDVPQIPANHLLVKNLSVIGFYIGAYLSFRPEVFRESLRTLINWYVQGKLKPPVSHVLPLDRAQDGFELLRSRQATGKIVVTPN